MVVGLAATLIDFSGDGKGRVLRPFQVGRVVVVQGETLPEVLGQFALGVEGGQARGAGLLPGAGVPVIVDVEQLHGLAAQEEAVLASFGHASHYRGYPAAAAQAAQHVPYPVLGGSRGGGQVGHAGQGHPWRDFQQSPLFVVQWLPGRHCHSSFVQDPSRRAAASESGRRQNPIVFPGALRRVHPQFASALGMPLFIGLILDIRMEGDGGLLISSYDGRKLLLGV